MNGSAQFYLSRKLHDGEQKSYTEQELRESQHTRYVVILAEPGAGKSELMNSIAKQLGTKSISANRFVRSQPPESCKNLVIDALDELAGSSDDKLHVLFSKIENVNPDRLIISSRSSEWNSSTTHICEEYIENKLINLWLEPFKEDEQRAIFDHHRPNEDFFHFQRQVARFDLDAVLPNPEFLKLLTDAYIESNREFLDKRDIFQKAITSLSKEHNTKIEAKKNNLTTGARIDVASEIFAKLLLAGCEGIASLESQETPLFPYLRTVYNEDKPAFEVLETKLFKPAEDENHHLPVHKIVSEYCAANYFVQRITNPKDELTLRQCLSVIAPNSVTRTELRGLLGWMAALGSAHTQETLIKLDPYAVLANGDPSQLTPTSKRFLIQQLQVEEEKDPYFCRTDFWRQFSVAGFFTDDVIHELNKILLNSHGGHLRDLLLELLVGSPVISQLENELTNIALRTDIQDRTRKLASQCLFSNSIDVDLQIIDTLLSKKDITSLAIVGDAFHSKGIENINLKVLCNFFFACSNLYPKEETAMDKNGGQRFFIKEVVSALEITTSEILLDKLSENLECNCIEQHYRCTCKTGISKIIGIILDHYFTIKTDQFNPHKIWNWLKNLHFHSPKDPEYSQSGKILQNHHNLRQKIILTAFRKLTKTEEIHKTKCFDFEFKCHSGLYFQEDDYILLVEYAYINKTFSLWSYFLPRKSYQSGRSPKSINSLRKLMRKQSQTDRDFLREWTSINRYAHQKYLQDKKDDSRTRRAIKKHRNKNEKVIIDNRIFYQKNRTNIEAGKNWTSLLNFSNYVLKEPEKIKDHVSDKKIVINSLINCINSLSKDIPNVREIAHLKTQSKYSPIAHVLYASIIIKFREDRTLHEIDRNTLTSLRAVSNISYRGISNSEKETLAKELDRLIFTDDEIKENFLRDYFEPQLNSNNKLIDFNYIRDDSSFSKFRGTLSIDWLENIPITSINPLQNLFELAIDHSDIKTLRRTILRNCSKLSKSEPLENLGELFDFWYIRAFYFLTDPPNEILDYIRSKKDNLLLFRRYSGRHSRYDYSNWPNLNATKIDFLLESFIDFWPKVELSKFFGSHSSKDEKAYRLLSDLVWMLEANESEESMDILNRYLNDKRFSTFHKKIKSILTNKVRAKVRQQTKTPSISNITRFLDDNQIISTDSLRTLVIEELQIYQDEINGGEFNPGRRFYKDYKIKERLGETSCTEIIAERLQTRLEQRQIQITPEHQLKDEKRADFTLRKRIENQELLLPVEVKGQWHENLYTAAAEQLHKFYSRHPNADFQGVYLVIWFGSHEAVAKRKKHEINSAIDLKESIEYEIPDELRNFIDVFVLDVSDV